MKNDARGRGMPLYYDLVYCSVSFSLGYKVVEATMLFGTLYEYCMCL